MKNFPVQHEGKTYWISRNTAVTCFVFAPIDGEWCLLANQRGKNAPDYQGYWNLPCGFLEANETGEEGVCREIFEECGYKILPGQMKLFNVETDPRTCNNGNVTIRYWNMNQYTELPKLKYTNINGEEGEVDSVKWINCKDINDYKWAFNHYNLIIEALFAKCGAYFGKIETITI